VQLTKLPGTLKALDRHSGAGRNSVAISLGFCEELINVIPETRHLGNWIPACAGMTALKRYVVLSAALSLFTE
jgi:hypothetical protein